MAFAGAWDPPEGGQSIALVSHGEESRTQQTEAQAYWEGVAPGGARVGKIWLRQAPDRDETRFEVMAARRWGFEGPADAAAVQGGLIVRGGSNIDAEVGAEARIMAGWDLGVGVYTGAEAGVQAFGGGAEARFEASLGRSGARSLTFLQLRYDQDQDGRGYARAEAAAVLFSAAGWGIQVGARAGLDHDERAFTIGLWRSPGRR